MKRTTTQIPQAETAHCERPNNEPSRKWQDQYRPNNGTYPPVHDLKAFIEDHSSRNGLPKEAILKDGTPIQDLH